MPNRMTTLILFLSSLAAFIIVYSVVIVLAIFGIGLEEPIASIIFGIIMILIASTVALLIYIFFNSGAETLMRNIGVDEFRDKMRSVPNFVYWKETREALEKSDDPIN